MIYDRFRDRLLALLKAPTTPPDPPGGSQGSARTFRADPNFLKLQLIVWGGGFAMGMLAELLMIIFIPHDKGGLFGWLLLVLTITGAIGKYFLVRIDYDMRYYVVTDRSLRIREGALIIHESTYTFANIQNLSVNQGPLERYLGLANLVVESAGGGGPSGGDTHGKSPFGNAHEGKLRGIANAREVRDQILLLMRRYRDAGLGDPEDVARAVPHIARAGFSPATIECLGEVLTEVRHLGEVIGRP